MKTVMAVLFSFLLSSFFLGVSIGIGNAIEFLLAVSKGTKVNIIFSTFTLFSLSLLGTVYLGHLTQRKPERILRDGTVFVLPLFYTWYNYWSIPKAITASVLITAMAFLLYQTNALALKESPA